MKCLYLWSLIIFLPKAGAVRAKLAVRWVSLQDQCFEFALPVSRPRRPEFPRSVDAVGNIFEYLPDDYWLPSRPS